MKRAAVTVASVAVVALAALVLVRRGASSRGGSGSPAAGASVLLITIDTLRADRVGAYGAREARTPNLDALARRGVLFEEALASTPLTLPSHSTILSGLEPPRHGVRDNGTYAFPADRPTLATLLQARGYATGAFVGAYVLDRRFGLARGFAHYDDRIERAEEGPSLLESERRCETVVKAATDWLTGQRPPFLAWVHVYDPHAPYDPPAPHHDAHPGRPYDGEVAYTDACLAPLLDAAERVSSGRLLTVAVGDHGEGLGEHGERTHGFFVYQSTLRVPLILAGPGVPAGERRRGPARTADVLPTLLALLGMPPPHGVDGADFMRGSRGGVDSYAETLYPASFGWAPLHAYRRDHLKYVEAPRPELYDLQKDPGEQDDLAARQPQDVERLSEALAAFRRGERRSATALDAEAEERLRALGYVAAAATASPAGPLKDPKDALPLWRRFEEAGWARMRGEAAAARRALSELVALEPGNATFRRTLASLLRQAGEPAGAVAALRELPAASAGDALAWHERSLALEAAGRLGEALRDAQRAVSLDPSLPEPLNHLGILESRHGRHEHALRAFEAATAIDPNNALAWSNRGNALRALGRRAEAAESYDTSSRLAPGEPEPLIGLGVLAAEDGRLEKAAELFRRALALHPDDPEATLDLAYVEARMGQIDAARARLKRLLASRPATEVAQRARRLLDDLRAAG